MRQTSCEAPDPELAPSEPSCLYLHGTSSFRVMMGRSQQEASVLVVRQALPGPNALNGAWFRGSPDLGSHLGLPLTQ